MALDDAAAVEPDDSTADWSTTRLLPRRPYPGLRPFEKTEWPIFRGRDRLVQDILEILARSHFASIIGPSGSGKSSLVKAGVLATLARRHARMGVQWRTAEMRPGATPLWSMADGILRALRPEMVTDGELPEAEVARIRALIDISEDGLAVILREFELEESENFLLLVDQFEEIFRYRSEEEDAERARLIELLLAVAQHKPSGLHVVTTMRSEYLGDCSRFTGLAETLNETHYLVPRMTEDELRQAIIEPAEIKDGHVQGDLVDRLIDDIKAQEDQLPILQHTLLWMWIQEEEKRQQKGLGADRGIRLGLADYERLEEGRSERKPERIRNALSRHGDRILKGLSAEERKVAAVMFRRMVEVEEHSSRLRRPTRAGTVAALAGVSLEVVQRVVDAFWADDASFIRVSRERLTNNASIDIMHESLIRQWSTLDGWVRREKASYEVYDNLRRAAQRMRGGRGGLLTELELSSARHWLDEERPTPLWARRYGGDFDAARSFLTDSIEAEEQRLQALKEAEDATRRREEEGLRLENERLRLEEEQSRLRAENSQLEQAALTARLEEQTKLARERARYMRMISAVALAAVIFGVFAGVGFWRARAEAERADQAVIDNNASSLWSRLQLRRDPLPPEDVAALWDLASAPEKVRVQFVHQLTEDRDRGLLARFGRNPKPLARAVGLKWPEEAGQAAEQRVAIFATENFNIETIDPFELTAYFRAVLALARRDRPIPDEATNKIDNAIRHLSGQVPDSKGLQALAQIVDAVGEPGTPEVNIAPETVKAARDSLRAAIVPARPNEAPIRDMAVSRAIEVMAPYLSPSERGAAIRYELSLLEKQVDIPWAPTTPRALLALLSELKPGEAPTMSKTLLHAVVATATYKRDSSYLLALMQVVEMLSGIPDQLADATLEQALVEELAGSDAVSRGALARASIPVLERRGDSTSRLVHLVVEAIFTGAVSGDVEDQLREALFSPVRDRRRAASQVVVPILLDEWTTKWPPNAPPKNNSDVYRWAAQARLIAGLAPFLTSASATDAMNGVLLILSQLDTSHYIAGEAMARALEALAPSLPESVRGGALSPAKWALARTGSREEAIAWTRAITALLPNDRAAFTHGVIEVLKYPTAAGAPTDLLLAALANRWPDEVALNHKKLPDKALLDWLEAHLPEGQQLTDPHAPPPLPPGWQSAHAGAEPS